jgi:tetratricopeptide (TPR) repeat protein
VARPPSTSFIRVRDAAAILGVTAQTLRRWDRSGVLSARRHPANNYRVYDEAEVRALASGAEAEVATSSVPAASRVPTAFPPPRALLGRAADLERLEKVLASGAPLVVVLGPAGVGKSSLLDGWIAGRAIPRVALGAARDVEDLCHLVAAACGEVIRAPTAEALAEALAEATSRHPLLALDEIENLEPHALKLIERLSAKSQIIATSRVRPRLAGEHVLRLLPLAIPDGPSDALASPAVTLLIAHLQKRGALEVIDERAVGELAAIARRLEGLPLALELAASRAATIGLSRVRRELEGSLEALGAGSDRALTATLRDSIARLPTAARATLVAASRLPRGFELSELERLVEGDASAALELLIDHSLLVARPGASAAELGFELHAAVREAALAEVPPAELELLDERHALLRAQDAASWASDRSSEAIRRIQRFQEPFAQAFRWWAARADRPQGARRAVDLARALGRLVEALGPTPGLHAALDRAIELGTEHGVEPGALAELHFFLGFALIATSRLDEAAATYARVLSLVRGGRNPRFEALTHAQCAWLHARSGAMDACAASLDAGLAVASAAHDAFPELLLHSLRAQAEMRQRKLAAARHGFERARALAIRFEDRGNEASATGFLGIVAFDEGAISEAARLFRESARLAAAHPAPILEAIFSGYHAIALHHLGDAGADVAYRTAIAAVEQVRSERFVSLFGAWHGVLVTSSGELEEGRRILDAADRLPDPEGRANVEVHRGHVDLAEADRALRDGREADALRHEARACERLLSVDEEPAARELRVSARFLEDALRRRADRLEGATLVVGFRGAWFECDGGARVELGSRAPLRRVLFRLVVGTLAHEGARVDLPTLVAAGWPSERLNDPTARHRLQVAISTLRQLGLGVAIELDEARGYRLLGSPRIAWSDVPAAVKAPARRRRKPDQR